MSQVAGNAGPAQPLPEPVERAAAAAGLGAFQRVYVPQRRNWALLIFMFIVGLLTTFVLVGFWLLWAIIRTPNFSRSMAARRLYLYENGFILVNRPDDPQAFRWDGIQTVFQKIISNRTYGVETGRTYTYTITAQDGRTVKVTQFWKDIADLGQRINVGVSSALLPAAQAAIEHGQGVQFGDMTLTAEGITGRRGSARWSDVSKVTIANGYVRVAVAGKFLALSNTAAAKIPNLPLFLTLAGRLRQQSR